MKQIKNLYLTNFFFYVLGGVIALFIISFIVEFLFPIAQDFLVIFIAILIVDIILVFHPFAKVKCERKLPKVFSLNDDNIIRLFFTNEYSLPLNLTIIDEIPEQFEVRDFERKLQLKPGQESEIAYSLTPKSRGEYIFYSVNIFISTTFRLVERRIVKDLKQTLPVYPSIIQMKNFELKAFSRTSNIEGVKRLRRLGHSYEFEQIKDYVLGDDYRSINWKATSRQGKLMVNQYEDEKSQQVYCIIDKSRVMKMPFDNLSLLDYAINSSLVLLNVALKKYDKAGLITFSDKIGSLVKAERNSTQINKILHALYREKERHLEANYELLYQASRRIVKGRSLIFLFTNFESTFAAERVLPILRKINNLHLLVVVFFENTEVIKYTEKEVRSVEEIYYQTIAQKFVSDKQQIVNKLRQYGIQTILTAPNDLSINTLNKYLELKSRGLI